MLTKWKLFNFKTIRQETELEFKPLTIFAGANSSGKSTVLQSILLVSQTLANAVTNRPIVLNGDLVRLGQFSDIKSNGSEASQITIGWELKPIQTRAQLRSQGAGARPTRRYYDPEELVQEVRTEISFDAQSGLAPAQALQLQPSLLTMEMECVVKSDDVGGEDIRTSAMTVRQRHGFSKNDGDASNENIPNEAQTSGTEAFRFMIEFDRGTETRRLQKEMAHDIDGVIMRHFLPSSLLVSYTEAELLTEAMVRALAGDSRMSFPWATIGEIGESPLPSGIVETVLTFLGKDSSIAKRINEILSNSKEIKVRDIANLFRIRVGDKKPVEPIRIPDSLRLEILALFSKVEKTDVIRRRLQMPEELRPSCQVTTNWFTKYVKYLGPLRDEPKSLYPLVANIDPRDVGLRGEHTAAVFHVHRDQIIEYIPTENFNDSRIAPTRTRRTLKFAVFEWLKYLGVATAVDTNDMGKNGHAMQARLYDGDEAHDLTHVGVGVSQVLPIVVSCLLAEPDTLLIFEQPELHLHPLVQERLADFFLAMSLLGKQCVLETHSEYLISRIRFRAAAAEGTQLVDTIQIYFAEKKLNTSSFRPVLVNEYGAIPDWPEGFFDQSQAEAEKIIREATRKRKQQQQKEKDNG